MTTRFDHIGSPETRKYIVNHLSDDTLLGRNGYTMRESVYVLPYPPEQESHAKDLIRAIANEDLPNRGVKAAVINLYDIVLHYLDESEQWDLLIDAESENTRSELIQTLQDVLDDCDVIIPAVQAGIDKAKCDIAFITGVGETFPYIRTHTLLGSLDTPCPVVLVFPGEYRRLSDGSTSLDILNIPSAANGGFYRATDIRDL